MKLEIPTCSYLHLRPHLPTRRNCAADDGELDQSRFDQVEHGGGNWADQDTNRLGTHRITGDFVDVRAVELSTVQFAVRIETQATLTYRTQEHNGYVYYETYIKSGEHAGKRGWVAKDYLAHTVLRVCNGNGINVRTGTRLEVVEGTANSGDTAYVISDTIRNTGSHRYFEVIVAGLRGFVAADCLCSGPSSGGSYPEQILNAHDASLITLWNETFGRNDGADPLNNIRDTVNGKPAKTSCYGTAPCTTVYLKDNLLAGMARLISDHGFSYFVTSIHQSIT
ncbi:MAG: hypothetical protein MJE77_24995 [Proteobacteria bacterium]|nr:hypothetical protein [Pseudomonadota bacterium]